MLIVQDVEMLAFNVLELEKHHLATALSLSYTLETVKLNIYMYISYIKNKKEGEEKRKTVETESCWRQTWNFVLPYVVHTRMAYVRQYKKSSR